MGGQACSALFRPSGHGHCNVADEAGILEIDIFSALSAFIIHACGGRTHGVCWGGSQRWINLGIITLQPSELMKPVMVLAAAWFFDRLPPNRIYGMDAIWPLGALLLLPSALVIIQPDFDAAIAYAFGLGVVGFMAGLPLI